MRQANKWEVFGMTKVKKKGGGFEEFKESKIVAVCQKAGASAAEAAQVGKEVTIKVAKMAIVPAEKIFEFVQGSLRRVNKGAADSYKRFRKQKTKIALKG
ncbi:MAG: hypothetical protein ABIG95_02890 [Candidatus Woesearchaeota archaeon]